MRSIPWLGRLPVGGLLLVSLLLLLVLGSMLYVRSEFRSYSARETGELQSAQIVRAQSHAHQINALLNQASSVALVTAHVLSVDTHIHEAELYELLKRNVGDHPLIYGAAVAFEPKVFGGRALFSPYVYRSRDTLAAIDIGAESYDYTQPQWEWYSIPKQQGRPVWTEPYFDEGAGNINMVTFSVPFFRNGKVAGITTIDLDLSKLLRLAEIDAKEGEEILILSRQANLVYRKQTQDISKPLGSVQTDFSAQGVFQLIRLASGGAGLIELRTRDQLNWISSAPIRVSDWSLLLRTDANTASRGILDVRDQILQLASAIVLIALAAAIAVWRLVMQRRKAAATLLAESRQREKAQQQLLEEMEVRTRVSQVAAEMREAEQPEVLADRLMSGLNRLMDISHGALYVARPDQQTLRLCGVYGIPQDQVGATCRYGEGLTGQCAVERRKAVLEIPTDDFWRLVPGLGESMPRWLMTIPIVHQDVLLGVLELALFAEPDAHQQQMIDELSSSLALHLKVLSRDASHGLEPA